MKKVTCKKAKKYRDITRCKKYWSELAVIS